MIIRRYIASSILASVFIILLVLLSLFGLLAFIDEFSSVGKGRYGVFQAMQYIGLRLLGIALQMIPLAALMGSIVGLGALASNSELTALRATGFSLRRIITTVLGVGCVLMLFSAVLGEYVVPITEQHAQRLRAEAISQNIKLGDDDELWARDGLSYINVGEVHSAGHLSNLTIYQLNDQHQVEQITYAKEAIFMANKWLFKTGKRVQFSPTEVTTRPFVSMSWEGRLTPEILRVFNVEPEQLSLQKLYRYYTYLKENGLESRRYEQAFWKKLVAPLVTGIMVVLAIPFVFGTLRSVSIGQRILVGVLVGLGFHLMNKMAGYVGVVYQVDPIVSATAPAAAFLILALILLRRVK